MASGPVGLWIDWGNDGFGTGAYDDCTSLVTRATYSRGSSPEITGAAQAGQAVFTVRNPAGLFNPDNASGPLYGLLRDGAPVWWGMREDGTIAGSSTATVRGRFAGRVVEVVPLPQAGAGDSTPLAQIICEDPLALYGRIPVALSDDCSPAAAPVVITPNAFMCGAYSAESTTDVPVYWESANDIGCGNIPAIGVVQLGSIHVFTGWGFTKTGTITFVAHIRSVPGTGAANRVFTALLNGTPAVTVLSSTAVDGDYIDMHATVSVVPGDQITFVFRGPPGLPRGVLNNATVQPTYILSGLLA